MSVRELRSRVVVAPRRTTTMRPRYLSAVLSTLCHLCHDGLLGLHRLEKSATGAEGLDLLKGTWLPLHRAHEAFPRPPAADGVKRRLRHSADRPDEASRD